MKKAIVAMGLALSLIVGNIAVYADSVKQVNKQLNNERSSYEKINESFNSLKDNNEDLADKVDVNFMDGVKSKDSLQIHLVINGMAVYTDSLAVTHRGKVFESAWLYKNKNNIIMIPLYKTALLMGAKYAGEHNNVMTFIKDGKRITFQSGKNYYKIDDELFEMEDVVTNDKGMWCVPFYGLVKAFDMNVHVDSSSKINTFSKYAKERNHMYKFQVLVWDKEMKLFHYGNPEVKKLVSNCKEWDALRKENYLDDAVPVIHYLLLDTKTDYDMKLNEVADEDSFVSFTSNNRELLGYANLIKDGKIYGELMYSNNAPFIVWSHFNGAFMKKSGKVLPFRLKKDDLREAEFIGIADYDNNVLTLLRNGMRK